MGQMKYLTKDDLDRIRVQRDGSGKPKEIVVYNEPPRDVVLAGETTRLANRISLEFGCSVRIYIATGEPITDGCSPGQRYDAIMEALVG